MADRLSKPLTGQYHFDKEADRLATLANIGLTGTSSDGTTLAVTDAAATGDDVVHTYELKSSGGVFTITAAPDDEDLTTPVLSATGGAVTLQTVTVTSLTAAAATIAGDTVLGTNVYRGQSTQHFAGRATMASGTVTVADTTVAAGDVILVTSMFANAGRLRVATINAGVSFVITSSDGTDGGSVSWVKVKV